jgi:hypothetical protein
MAKRGRPRASAQYLKDRGAKPSVWRRRQREELAQLAATNPVKAYLSELERETAMFAARITPGEIVMRDLNGSRWESFPVSHWLLMIRDYAQKSLADPACGSWTKELCTRFLADLDPSATHGFLLDPVAVEAVQRMYEIWQTPETNLNYLRLLAVIEFLAWKRPDGELRFADEELLNLNPLDVEIIDRMILATRTVDVAA